jgi:hypothetical protein
MDAATENRPAGNRTAFLAGLQAGMLGVLWMLAWIGVSSTLQRRSFWTAENLLASVFYGDSMLRPDFTAGTFFGIALYLLIYSLLGALFAMAVRDRLRPGRRALFSIMFALTWYYLSFHLIWKSLAPLVYLLHSDRSTLFGHVIYGAVLARFPVYFHPPKPATSAQPAQSESQQDALAETPAETPAPTETHSGTPEGS